MFFVTITNTRPGVLAYNFQIHVQIKFLLLFIFIFVIFLQTYSTNNCFSKLIGVKVVV